jgi:putative ABC transport system permease protein
VFTAALGTWAAIARTLQLPPAEAMRPEAPPTYRATLVERLGLARLFSPATRMVLRELERKPARAAMTITGVAFAVGLTVMNAFTFDSVDHMLNVQFGLNQREDVHLSLIEPRATGILSELESLPGVEHAEPFRTVPVRLRAGPRMRHVGIVGIPADASLQAIHDVHLRRIEVPAEGLVLSRKLAEILAVSAGDRVRVEILEGRRATYDLEVARIAETFFGLSAQMDLAALCRLLGETQSLNGAWLVVDEHHLGELHAVVKRTPMIAGVSTRHDTLRNAQKVIDGYLGTWVGICLAFSLVMACGVLYNAARITLAERSRELASLRVLGFRRNEVARILLGELAVLTAVAIPLGLLLGRSLAAILVSSPGYDTEQFRLPLVISQATYALAVTTVLAAALISGWIVWRRLDRINIVEVLKCRD